MGALLGELASEEWLTFLFDRQSTHEKLAQVGEHWKLRPSAEVEGGQPCVQSGLDIVEDTIDHFLQWTEGAQSTQSQPANEGTKSFRENKQGMTENDMQQLAQAIGDDNASRILAIVQRRDWSGERKMREIVRIDNRFVGKNSNDWATLLGVKPAAVRGYSLWKQLRKTRKDLS